MLVILRGLKSNAIDTYNNMSVFIVVSFDFGGNSNVVLHILTVDQVKAENMYDSIIEAVQKANEMSAQNDEACKHLVELAKVPLEFGTGLPNPNIEEHTFFWGANSNVLVLRSNNN
jgi:hypothetical protein